jgi:hypothetical protein
MAKAPQLRPEPTTGGAPDNPEPQATVWQDNPELPEA